MVEVKRTLCDHPNGRAENDAEHSFMLALIATSLAEEYFPELDSGLVSKYAVIHDLVEAYVDDTPTHEISEDELASKAKRETKGLKKLAADFAETAPAMVRLIEAYEQQSDNESRFVRMLDKVVTVSIQFPNHGDKMREYFADREGHQTMVATRIERFSAEYSDQSEVLDLYQELATFMQDVTWPTSA